MSYDPDRLYNLLPAIHRIRDAEQGEPLRQLLAVITQQIGMLEEDLEQLYDDQFIETCAPWVLPYIGDLIGYRSLHPIGPDQLTPRAEVANTIAYRRRKGTASVLEQLARDVTGWNARAVEFFQLLGCDAVHESHPPNELLRAGPAAMGAARTPGHGVRDERAHDRRPAHRARAKANTTSRTSEFSSGG